MLQTTLLVYASGTSSEFSKICTNFLCFTGTHNMLKQSQQAFFKLACY